MSKKTQIVTEAAFYIQSHLLGDLPTTYFFHNYECTKSIVGVANDLAKQASLTPEQTEDILLAAWFLNIGYIQQHEQQEDWSTKVVRTFLEEKAHPEERIAQIEEMILSTKPNITPTNTAEKILHDAKWSFLGRKRFFKKSQLLRLEQSEIEGKKYTSSEWNKFLLDLLLEIKFHTIWAQARFNNRKNKNIAEQWENFRTAKDKTTRRRTGKNFGRGIDTLYRITLRNHLNLSSIADGKASMIISINTLVLSILITAGAAGLSVETLSLASNFHVVAPIIVLMISSLGAIIFAVLSAIPKISGNSFTTEDVEKQRVSLFFFGNFLKLEKENYVHYLRELKKDQELLYDNLSRDLYNLGAVLKKKYTLLQISYRVFIGGLIASVVVFLLTYALS